MPVAAEKKKKPTAVDKKEKKDAKKTPAGSVVKKSGSATANGNGKKRERSRSKPQALSGSSVALLFEQNTVSCVVQVKTTGSEGTSPTAVGRPGTQPVVIAIHDHEQHAQVEGAAAAKSNSMSQLDGVADNGERRGSDAPFNLQSVIAGVTAVRPSMETRDSVEPLAQFKQRMQLMLQGGFLGVAINIGLKLNLFDKLADGASQKEPIDASRLAECAGMKELYVKNWLLAMSANRMVECDESGQRFWIPPQNHATIVDLAPMLLHLPNFYRVEDELSACFADNGPLGTSPYVYDQLALVRHKFARDICRRYVIDNWVPSMAEVMLDANLKDGGLWLEIGYRDAGCGWTSSEPIRLINEQFEHVEFHINLCDEECVKRMRIDRRMPDNVRYEAIGYSDTERSQPRLAYADNSVDLVSFFDGLHDMPFPDRILDEAYRVLKPGHYLSVVDQPGYSNVANDRRCGFAPLMALNHCINLYACGPMSAGQHRDAAPLGTACGILKIQKMVDRHGFVDVQVRFMDYDPYHNNVICAKPMGKEEE